jgi:hypothetical protein
MEWSHFFGEAVVGGKIQSFYFCHLHLFVTHQLPYFTPAHSLTHSFLMTRLTRKDNDILRRQEWRLLFVPGGGTSSASSTSSATAQGSAFQLHSQTRNTVPEDYAQDTFLVKAFFSETEKYYIVMLTNMKQTWYEKLELYAIRERSKVS